MKVSRRQRRLRLREAMRLFDGLPHEGRALAADYGLAKALGAYSQTGDWAYARAYLADLFGSPLRPRSPSVGSGENPEAAP